jgi:hypothetical protein
MITSHTKRFVQKSVTSVSSVANFFSLLKRIPCVQIEQGFGTIEQSLGTIEQGFGTIEQGFGSTEQDFGSTEQGFGTFEQGFGSIKTDSNQKRNRLRSGNVIKLRDF